PDDDRGPVHDPGDQPGARQGRFDPDSRSTGLLPGPRRPGYGFAAPRREAFPDLAGPIPRTGPGSSGSWAGQFRSLAVQVPFPRPGTRSPQPGNQPGMGPGLARQEGLRKRRAGP